MDLEKSSRSRVLKVLMKLKSCRSGSSWKTRRYDEDFEKGRITDDDKI